MKLLKLNISDYKLLQNLEISFDPKDSFSVIIGKNGSGKTTLIECITIIFSQLLSAKTVADYRKMKFPFNFSLSYLLKKEKNEEGANWLNSDINYVQVDITYNKKIQFEIHVGTQVLNTFVLIEKYLRGIGESVNYFLPKNLVVYYSGISDIILRLFRKYQGENILGSLDGEVTITQPFYFFVLKDLPMILIALLSFGYGDIPETLFNKFGITGFSSIIITFKKPEWAKGSSRTLWGARGDLKNFLRTLEEFGDEIEFKEDVITFSFKDKSQLERLWSNLGTEKRLFEYLVALQANGLIKSISITLLKNNLAIDYQRLSEGEKQSLIIIGLIGLLATENSLFLLDEPDTYLHPKWKREFIYEFENLIAEYNNFTIVTSHSPNIVSGLNKRQLKILENVGGISQLKSFDFNPYGKPVDNILIDFFGIDGLRYKKVEDKLDQVWNMLNKNEHTSVEFKELYNSLENEIGKDDEDLVAIKIEIAKKENAENK